MLVSMVFVHSEFMCFVIARKAHNFIMCKKYGRSMYILPSVHTSQIYTATQSYKTLTKEYLHLCDKVNEALPLVSLR